ncbi:MarR family winged helix-turn-helix transcriptional regulator [Nonomuraea angiospora]|uniref:DNA-binding MarR family transcriptional regulator n=1 Tax=Nonomuraea angiospora TaxID=46172 RepID=A0ABR9MH77_9ACTN|nr:MarR family winged helix-turn-helix transcriptional regulator [Nonomuraea angiospora]MBE1592252.1 DNA-binding MarR family transcriptional regulator [Nonomuraea angiospora]
MESATDAGARPGPGFAATLVRMSHLVQHVFADVSRERDITPQQAQLLCVLTSGDGIGMTDLSRLLHLEKPSLTGLVDRAERRGLVRRVRDDADRRACRVELTSEGEDLAVRVHGEIVSRLEALAADLPGEDRLRVADTLTILLAQTC